MNNDWTKEEARSIVKDYFEMLQPELNHKNYNKPSVEKNVTRFVKKPGAVTKMSLHASLLLYLFRCVE